MNPRKEPAIKAEIEKLLKVGFIYLVPLMEWVSNPILLDNKQGAIHICIDFHELNRAFPKDDFPTPFIDHILDECVGSEVFFFMDIFLDIIRFRSSPRINIRPHLFVLGVLLHIKRFPSALKMPKPHFNEP